MKCYTCRDNEPLYEYETKDGWTIPICKTCGEKLYGAGIGDNAKDSKSQVEEMIEYVKIKKCSICEENEGIHNYELIDGHNILVCKDCGEILYGTGIGMNALDVRIQLAQIMDYVDYVRLIKQYDLSSVTSIDENSKVLTLLKSKKVS